MTDIEDRLREDKVNRIISSQIKHRQVLAIGTPIAIILLAFIIYIITKMVQNVKTSLAAHANTLAYGAIALLCAGLIYWVLSKKIIAYISKKWNNSKVEVTHQTAVTANPVAASQNVTSPAESNSNQVDSPSTDVDQEEEIKANQNAISAAPEYTKGEKKKEDKLPTNPIGPNTSKKKQVPLHPISTGGDEVLRWLICITFHAFLGTVGWMGLDYYLYTPLGNGFLSWVVSIIGWSALTWSFINTFDRNTIKPNYAAEMYYLGVAVFSNVTAGFTCLGLPKWLTTIQVVNFKQMAITIGLMKGDKREPLVIEANMFAAIFDIMFLVQPNNTAKILALLEPAEKILVAILNSVLFRFANMESIDEDGNVIHEDVEEEIDGVKKTVEKAAKLFPTIDSLKAATAQLTHEILDETGEHSARYRMQEKGFYLLDLTLKDIENPDKEILTAAQKLVAKALYEKAEMLSTQNTLAKIKFYYDGLNTSGQPNQELMDECVRMVQREEGKITTNEITGGTGNGRGKRGKNNQSGPAANVWIQGGSGNNKPQDGE